ncbi:MAG: hypothetical protein ACYTEQ_23495 [Planctomycetota bacterium]|jgi:hypothetical protein
MLSAAETIKLNLSIPAPQPTPPSHTTTSNPATHPIARQLAHPAGLGDHDLIIMQNKPNFSCLKDNASSLPTKAYENENAFRLQENKPNKSQFQRQKSAAAVGVCAND